jgi:hypothetical protein
LIFTVLAGPAYAPNSVISSVSDMIAGSWNSFSVILFDAADNPVTKGGDLLSIQIQSSSNLVPPGQIQVFDNKNGSYTFNFTIFTADVYGINLTVDGIFAGLTSVTVYPTSVSIVDSLINATTNITFGQNLTINVYLRDKYQNYVNLNYSVFAYVYLSTNPNFKPLKANLTAISEYQYTAEWNYNLTNIDRSQNCSNNILDPACNFNGTLAVVSGIFMPGVRGKYYANQNFYGVAKVDEIDANINFAWGGSVNGISSTNVSVYWEGFIIGNGTSVMLGIFGNDWCFVDSDYVQVMRLPDRTNVTLANDLFYYVSIRYNSTSSAANFGVSWNSGGTFVPVPSSNWATFYQEEMIGGGPALINSS